VKLDISLVPYGLITTVVGRIQKYVETAAKYSKGRSSADDIIRMFYNNTYQLWVVIQEDSGIIGFFATEVKIYPQCKMLTVQHTVIEPNHMAGIESRMQELATLFAKDHGCAGVEFVGRPGWKKHAGKFGYTSSSVVYQRFFEKVK
jgi:dTDP-D-glucose 4,6-dehydratase